ncbi:MAG: twin-arginine translocase TatA/TatE family subunit [Saprospiraceae bacterium]|nr:twin-arginine translocase TatA/TatE family subunit [Saprospiraceae bacterium]
MISETILLGILGGQELIIIAIIILVLFGGKKLPELMKGLGKGIKEFKDVTNSTKETIMKEIDGNEVVAAVKETKETIKKEIEDNEVVSDVKDVKETITGKSSFSNVRAKVKDTKAK